MERSSILLGAMLLCLLPVLPLSAQDASGSLNLEAAQKEALDSSPAARKAKAVEREAGWGQFEAVAEGFLPHLSVTGEHLFDVDYPSLNVQFGAFPPGIFPGISPRTSLKLDASFDLFDGLRNVHKLDAANHRHEAARVRADHAVLQLEEEVRLRFYKALAAQMLSEMADQNVETLQGHLRVAQDVVKNGQGTRYDLLRVEVQVSEAGSEQVRAHDDVALARAGLAQAMGLGKDERPLQGSLPVPDAPAILREIEGTGTQASPLLLAQEQETLAAADKGAAALSAWMPKVSLVGEYQWYNSPDFLGGVVQESSDFRTAYFVGATATWDVFDEGVVRFKEAEERADQAREDLRETRLSLPRDLDLWKRRLATSSTLYQATLADLDKAKESVRLATVGFKAGTRTTTDVLDAELEQFRAQARRVQAQMDALEALVNIELILGRKVGQ